MAAASPNYPAAFFAKLFNVSERRIQQLAKEGVIPKAARGKYPLIGVIQGYVSYLQERSLGQEFSDSDFRAERIRLTRAQAESLELKNEIAKREVAPIELLTHAVSNGATQIAAILGSVPLNIKRQIPRLTSTEIETIKREIVKAQNAAAAIKIDFDVIDEE